MSEDLTNKLSQSGEDRILSAIQGLDTRVGNLDSRVDMVLSAVKDLDIRVGNLDIRVGNLDSRVDNLDTRVSKIDCRLLGLERGQERMRLNILELNNMAQNVNRDQILMNEIVRRMQVDFINFNERLLRLLTNRDQQNSST